MEHSRFNKKGVPDEIQTTNLQKRETFTQDGMLLFVKWKDKRDVAMVSTFHDDTMLEKRRPRLAHGGVEVENKSKMVEDYNMHMTGVDKYEVYTLYIKKLLHINMHDLQFLQISAHKSLLGGNLVSSVCFHVEHTT